MVSFSKNKSRLDRNSPFVPQNPASYGLLIDERELDEFSQCMLGVYMDCVTSNSSGKFDYDVL